MPPHPRGYFAALSQGSRLCKLGFGGQCPLAIRYGLRLLNIILWAFSTGRYDPLGVWNSENWDLAGSAR